MWSTAELPGSARHLSAGVAARGGSQHPAVHWIPDQELPHPPPVQRRPGLLLQRRAKHCSPRQRRTCASRHSRSVSGFLRGWCAPCYVARRSGPAGVGRVFALAARCPAAASRPCGSQPCPGLPQPPPSWRRPRGWRRFGKGGSGWRAAVKLVAMAASVWSNAASLTAGIPRLAWAMTWWPAAARSASRARAFG